MSVMQRSCSDIYLTYHANLQSRLTTWYVAVNGCRAAAAAAAALQTDVGHCLAGAETVWPCAAYDFEERRGQGLRKEAR